MLFDEGHIGNHLMDRNFENWILFIIGIGILVMIGLIVVYFILRNVNSNSKLKSQMAGSNENINHFPNKNLEKNEEISYCYSCGEKFDDRSLKFCPYCGTEIE